jgi:hypothetical protein
MSQIFSDAIPAARSLPIEQRHSRFAQPPLPRIAAHHGLERRFRWSPAAALSGPHAPCRAARGRRCERVSGHTWVDQGRRRRLGGSSRWSEGHQRDHQDARAAPGGARADLALEPWSPWMGASLARTARSAESKSSALRQGEFSSTSIRRRVAQLLREGASCSLAITWSMLKLADFCRCGNSMNDCRASATYACAGVNTQMRSIIQSK